MKLIIFKSKNVVKGMIITILTSDSLNIHVNPDDVKTVEY